MKILTQVEQENCTTSYPTFPKDLFSSLLFKPQLPKDQSVIF